MGRTRKIVVRGLEVVENINRDLKDGVKETGSPALDALLEPGFPKKTNREALEIALQVQALLRGDMALVRQAAQGVTEAQESIQRLTERMDRYDRAEEKFDSDPAKFVDDAIQRADKLKLTGERKDKLIATASAQYRGYVDDAKAKGGVNRIAFDRLVETMPKEQVMWPYTLEIIDGATKQVPLVIRIRHRAWSFKPGEVVQVPTLVAERIREIQVQHQELSERQQALSGDLSDVALAQRWGQISQKYRSGTDTFHTADGAF
jgi:hypothetical protein